MSSGFFLKIFFRFDKESDGSIGSVDFYKIMTTVKGHLLTEFVRNNLVAVAGGTTTTHKVKTFKKPKNSRKIDVF